MTRLRLRYVQAFNGYFYFPRDRIVALMQWLGTSRPIQFAAGDVLRV